MFHVNELFTELDQSCQQSLQGESINEFMYAVLLNKASGCVNYLLNTEESTPNQIQFP